MQVAAPLRKALIDAYADVPGMSAHEIEHARQTILERNAAEIVAIRAANGNGPPPQKETDVISGPAGMLDRRASFAASSTAGALP